MPQRVVVVFCNSHDTNFASWHFFTCHNALWLFKTSHNALWLFRYCHNAFWSFFLLIPRFPCLSVTYTTSTKNPVMFLHTQLIIWNVTWKLFFAYFQKFSNGARNYIAGKVFFQLQINWNIIMQLHNLLCVIINGLLLHIVWPCKIFYCGTFDSPFLVSQQVETKK
jgi:hypothetical protein